MMRGRQKSSNVWEHFSRPDSRGAVLCKHCKVHLKYCNSTGSLLKHIKQKHPFVVCPVTGTSSSSTNRSRSRSPSSTFRQDENPRPKQGKIHMYTKQPVTPGKAKVITELILNTIIGDLRPINLIEGENFKRLIEELAPGYCMPSRRTFTRKVEDKFLSCKSELGKILASAPYISLTTDMWSSVKMQSFLGITAHFVDTKSTKLELMNLVIATKEVQEAHTGDNIVLWIESVLDELEVSPHQIVAIVTDNGANIVNACGTLMVKYGWIHVRCAAHTIQLCIKSGLEVPAIKSAIGAARHLVIYFRQSAKASQALRSLQLQNDNKVAQELILDVSTRWNSTYLMLDRLCHLQSAVRQVLCNPSVTKSTSATHLELKDAHWALIQNLVEKLKPLKLATDFLEGEQYVSVAAVVPIIKGLAEKFTACEEDSRSVTMFKEKIFQSLKSRFDYVFKVNMDNPKWQCQ